MQLGTSIGAAICFPTQQRMSPACTRSNITDCGLDDGSMRVELLTAGMTRASCVALHSAAAYAWYSNSAIAAAANCVVSCCI